jgi:hypothetical protein
MERTASDSCLTCGGAGEVGTELGLLACPDCFGDGRRPGRGASFEWRLRQIEQRHHAAGGEVASDLVWLVHELRRTRQALTGILTRCQDAEEGDAFAAAIRYQANEALGLYDVTPEPPHDGPRVPDKNEG